MSLLKYLRSECGLTRSQIVSIIANRNCPPSWTALKIRSFINELSNNHGTKAEELGADIKSNESIEPCNDCHEPEFFDDMRSCYQGDWYVCEDCCGDNYAYSDNQDTYISYDDYDEENHNQGTRG